MGLIFSGSALADKNLGRPPLTVPADNPQTPEKIALEEVIEYYDKGGDKNRFIDAKIFPLHPTQQEKADLLAFMKTLTSQQP